MKSNSIQHKDQAENIRLKCQLNYGEPPRKLRRSLMHSIRNLKIHWPHRISNQQLNESTTTIKLSWTIKRRRLKWEIHVLRIDNSSNLTLELNFVHLGSLWKENAKKTKATSWRCTLEKVRKKTWGGVTVRERCRLLQASVVNGVFCYTVSCVLRDRKG